MVSIIYMFLILIGLVGSYIYGFGYSIGFIGTYLLLIEIFNKYLDFTVKYRILLSIIVIFFGFLWTIKFIYLIFIGLIILIWKPSLIKQITTNTRISK